MKKPVLALAAGLALWGLANTSHADSIVSVTETHYDTNLRPDCVAIRMNVATFADAPSDACTPKASVSANGPDRITKTIYDAAGQVEQVIQAYGTSSQRVYSTFSYSPNGKLIDTIDANGNRTHNVYDGFDRLVTLYYPSTTRPSAFNPSTQATALSTAGAYNSADYEQFTYDANSNRKTWRRRNGLQVTYIYDALNRETRQGGDITDWDTTYDLQGHVLSKLYGTGLGVSYTYDALGQVLSTTDWLGRTVKYQYNQASGRTKLTYPDGNWVGYTLDNLSRVTALGMNAYSGLSLQSYDDLGRVQAENRGYLAASARINFTYDGLGRLTKMINNFAGTNGINDVTWTFSGRNPAGQITTWGASVTDYDYVETATATDNRTYDGLNRDASIAAVSGGYDANGNLANDGTRVMTYDFYNRLTKVADPATPNTALVTLRYDTEGRLASYTASGVTTEFLYDGSNLIAEYKHVTGTDHSADVLQERYIHGTGVDEPLVWYHGSDLTDQRYFWRNYQGSLIAYGDDGGHMTELYKYGPYGEPRTSSNGDGWGGTRPRFAYTGQIMIPEAKLYYYKARVYDPAYGRFLQTDPVGSKDDLDLYAYVGGDPINKSDPTGNGAWDDFLKNVGQGFSYHSLSNLAPGQENDIQASAKDRNSWGFAVGYGLYSMTENSYSNVHSGALRGNHVSVPEGGAVEAGVRQVGGAYKDVRAAGFEAHHMPANSVSPLSKADGPAISMTVDDHKMTASWGNSRDAQSYRQSQSNLINNGDFRGAQQMDINDIQSKFGNKYDPAIHQMQKYTDDLGQ